VDHEQIAIIDDGINEGLYNTGALLYNIEITSGLEIRRRTGYDPFLPSHGTTCAAIIKKYAPDAVVGSIKILNDSTKRGMKNQLVKALEWCAGNGIRLVNVSLGTIDYRDFDEVGSVVKNAREKGLVIVAACNNRNIYTCPASLQDVIGVKCDLSKSLKEGEFVYNCFAPDGIEITGCAGHSVTSHSGNSKITSRSNSFAAPMITAVVHEIIKNNQGIALTGIREELKKRSVKKTVRINNPLDERSVNFKEIDVPIIAVFAGTEKTAADIAGIFAGLFREDGYNTAIAAHKESLRMVYAVYDPDVILIAVHSPDELKKLDRAFKIDILIHCGRGDAGDVKESLRDGSDAGIITLSDDAKAADAYKCIIGIFERKEKNACLVF